MGKKRGWDNTVEFINHELEIWIQLDQFFDRFHADNNKV
jgi:hypothetical protein